VLDPAPPKILLVVDNGARDVQRPGGTTSGPASETPARREADGR
jgi:hypothetical protein